MLYTLSISVLHRLGAPRPNPFSGDLAFSVEAPASTERVSVRVLDMRGRLVATLHEGPLRGERDFLERAVQPLKMRLEIHEPPVEHRRNSGRQPELADAAAGVEPRQQFLGARPLS